jgi:diadenosine tetraphosphate (Ap4A) HIT family hydrolase
MKQKTFVDPDNARNPDYRKKLEEIFEKGIDPFSKEHLQNFDKKEILYETKHWFVFKNQYPYPGAKTQFVIVCQQYKETIEEISISEMTDLLSVSAYICDKYKILGGGFTMRFGDTKKSGATVKRLHAQIIEPEDGHGVAAWFGSEKK